VITISSDSEDEGDGLRARACHNRHHRHHHRLPATTEHHQSDRFLHVKNNEQITSESLTHSGRYPRSTRNDTISKSGLSYLPTSFSDPALVQNFDDGYLTVSYNQESDTEDVANSALHPPNTSIGGSMAAAAMPCPTISPSNVGGASSSAQREHQHQSHIFSASNIKHELTDKMTASQSIFTPQSFAGASSSLPQIPGSDSLQLRPTGVTTTSSSTHHSKQHAKVSPYIPKQEHLGAPSEKDNKHRGARSPKTEKITPFDVQLELSSAAAQGKLAYVSPTVRAMPVATAAKLAVNVSGGSISTGAPSHRGASNMRLCVQQTGSSGVSHLSPVQLAQPVLLNTSSQVDMHSDYRRMGSLHGSPLHQYLLPAHQQMNLPSTASITQFGAFSPSVAPPPAHQSPRQLQYSSHPLPAHMHPVPVLHPPGLTTAYPAQIHPHYAAAAAAGPASYLAPTAQPAPPPGMFTAYQISPVKTRQFHCFA